MDAATFENRVFKSMVLASVGIHVGIFLWSHVRDSSAAISFQEMSIQADLEMESPVASISSQYRAEEIKVDKQILPQLPKQFEVQEKPEQDEKQNDELALKEEEHKEEEKKTGDRYRAYQTGTHLCFAEEASPRKTAEG